MEMALEIAGAMAPSVRLPNASPVEDLSLRSYNESHSIT